VVDLQQVHHRRQHTCGTCSCGAQPRGSLTGNQQADYNKTALKQHSLIPVENDTGSCLPNGGGEQFLKINAANTACSVHEKSSTCGKSSDGDVITLIRESHG